MHYFELFVGVNQKNVIFTLKGLSNSLLWSHWTIAQSTDLDYPKSHFPLWEQFHEEQRKS